MLERLSDEEIMAAAGLLGEMAQKRREQRTAAQAEADSCRRQLEQVRGRRQQLAAKLAQIERLLES
jgi:hypothetical protein